MVSHEQLLSEIYQLIEQEKLATAREKLQPLLSTDATNPDIWWLYAHAVEEPQIAQEALKRVLNLDPSYPGAQELLETLSSEQTAPVTIRSLKNEVPKQSDEIDLSDFELDSDEEDDDWDEEEIEKRRFPIGFLVLITLLVLAVLGLLFIFNPNRTPSVASPTATSEQIAIVPATETPSSQSIETMMPSPIVEPSPDNDINITTEVTAESTGGVDDGGAGGGENGFDDFETKVREALTNNAIEDVTIIETNMGSTTVVTICAGTSEENNENLNTIFQTMADIVIASEDVTDAIGVELIGCDANIELTPRLITATTSDAAEFATGLLDLKSFQSRWRPN